jgi:hypothetical protein
MSSLSRRAGGLVATALVALMVATRFKHFGDALHLPDASMALFFLGGLYLRRHLAFAGLVLLAFLIDEASVHWLGVSDFCMTPAYAFLPLAYAVLWYAGRGMAGRLEPTPRSLLATFAVAVLAAAGSFAISNGSFYWLGGRYAHPQLGEYVARLLQWGPMFVRTTSSYVAVALSLHALAVHLAARGTARAWKLAA